VLQNGQVLADRLAGHVQPGAQLTQALPVAAVQAVEQPSPAGVGQRPEHFVHGGQPQLLIFMSSGEGGRAALQPRLEPEQVVGPLRGAVVHELDRFTPVGGGRHRRVDHNDTNVPSVPP
jgi:hypothetical protein